MTGYDPNFFSEKKILLPKLTATQKKLRAALKNKANAFELKYTHFSILQNKKRKFAFFTATNIDGKTWQANVVERDDFEIDGRLSATHQTGNELYDFFKSKTANDFDRGHITKFQDPQWGDDSTIEQAARDTMKFVNCVPQHHRLNRGAWKSLEDYILKKFTRKTGADGSKLSVFAGPLLLQSDPFYIDRIDEKTVQIPCDFWKIVVYLNKRNKLSAAGFLMSQKTILFKHNFVVDQKVKVRGAARARLTEADFFTDFTSGEPYQVRIDFLEEVTGYRFGLNNLFQPYTKTEATELIYKRVEVPVSRGMQATMKIKDLPLNFKFEGISL
jgi:endonuclease G